MTPEQFKAWRKIMSQSRTSGGDLGVSPGSIELYERGTRRNDHRVLIPFEQPALSGS